MADASDDQRLTVEFPGLTLVYYRIGRLVADVAAADLATLHNDTAVSVDAGPVEGLRRYPREALWRWRV